MTVPTYSVKRFLPLDAAAAVRSYCGGAVSFLAQVLMPIHA